MICEVHHSDARQAEIAQCVFSALLASHQLASAPPAESGDDRMGQWVGRFGWGGVYVLGVFGGVGGWLGGVVGGGGWGFCGGSARGGA